MFGTDSTRTLLGPADPARGMPEPQHRLPAMTLIDRAELTAVTGPARRPAIRRTLRLALSGTTAVAAAAAVAVVLVSTAANDHAPTPRAGDNPPVTTAPAGDGDLVVTPVAFTIADNPPAARDQLRALAKRIGAAPYDSRTGRYAYVHSKTWGDPQMGAEGGKYTAGYTHDDETWLAANQDGTQRTTMLPHEFPDKASRDYFKNLPAPDGKPSSLKVEAVGALPTDRAGLARMLHASRGVGDMAKAVNTVYSRYAVSRASRAMILELLADQAGFRWRGEVTDRAGRKGVAISGDQRGGRSVLIFDPVTGALLAQEHVRLDASIPVLSSYNVFLAYDRQNSAPAVPTNPGPPSTTPGTQPGVS